MFLFIYLADVRLTVLTVHRNGGMWTWAPEILWRFLALLAMEDDHHSCRAFTRLGINFPMRSRCPARRAGLPLGNGLSRCRRETFVIVAQLFALGACVATLMWSAASAAPSSFDHISGYLTEDGFASECHMSILNIPRLHMSQSAPKYER